MRPIEGPRAASSGPRAHVRGLRALALASFIAVFALSGTAVAQEAPPEEDDDAQVFDFDEDEISTDYLKPNTMMVEGLRRGRMSSLISVRLHFVDEIVRSAEDI